MSAVKYTESLFTSVTRDGAGDHRQYGGNLRTPYMATCTDGRTRRVYAMCYGNAASVYVRVAGEDLFLGFDDEAMVNEARRRE